MNIDLNPSNHQRSPDNADKGLIDVVRRIRSQKVVPRSSKGWDLQVLLRGSPMRCCINGICEFVGSLSLGYDLFKICLVACRSL